MKKLSIAALIILIVAFKGPDKQDGFIIQGSVKGITQKMAYIERNKDGNREKIDSSVIDPVTGKFKLKGKVESPEMLMLNLGKGKTIRLFVENAQIQVIGDSIQNVKITGSKSQDEYKAYSDKVGEINKEVNEIDKRFAAAQIANDTVLMKSLDEQYNSLAEIAYEKQKAFSKNYVKENKSSFVAPYILWTELSYDMEVGEMDSIVKLFDARLAKSSYVHQLNDRIEILKKVAIGQPAPEFMMNDSTGRQVKLSSFFGKYLLVDFWASWCGPCRRENPNVVAAFKEYNSRGFDILGVSLDRDRAKWLMAIKKDNLSWHHVSDLQYWNNAAAKQYGIRSIPANLLLDKNGIIIAKNLRGEDLKKKLDELLK